MRTKSTAAKRKKPASSTTGKSSTPAPSKKAKKATSDSEEEPPEPQIVLTVYIHIPKNAPATTSRSRKTPAPEIVEYGPFDLLPTDTYTQFLTKLAETLPCRTENIHQSKIKWKPKVPKNAQIVTLGKETGYKAMITEMEAKKLGARTVILMMPAPAEPMEEDVVSPLIPVAYLVLPEAL